MGEEWKGWRKPRRQGKRLIIAAVTERESFWGVCKEQFWWGNSGSKRARHKVRKHKIRHNFEYGHVVMDRSVHVIAESDITR